MGLLNAVERALKSVVEGAFGRAFGGHVHPAELAKALLAAQASSETRVGRERRVANAYSVLLSPADFAALESVLPVVRAELISALRKAAEGEGWTFVGPVTVALEVSPQLSVGMMHIEGSLDEGIPRCRLRVLRGPDTGAEFVVRQQSVVLGRDPTNDITLADTTVSRVHTRLLCAGDTVRIEDLASTNGTFVNHQRVERAELAGGDLIQMGGTMLVLERED